MDYKNININDFIQSGEGGTSFTYFHKTNKNIMLKIFKPNVDKSIAIDEYNLSKKVENLGLVTPKALALTKVNDENCIVYERVKNKISFSRMMANDSSTIEYCAKNLATYAKKLHTTPCDTLAFNNIKVMMQNMIDKSSFDNDIKKSLQDLMNNTIDEPTCVHGDFQPSNYLDSNGTTYIIDLSTFSYGNHMFDIGALYFSCCVIITEEEKIDLFHMSLSDLKKFFDIFCRYYLQTDDEKIIKDFYNEAHRYSALILNAVYQILGCPAEKKKIYEDRIKEALAKQNIKKIRE